MSITCGQLVVERGGRVIALQAYTDDHAYRALRIFGVRASVAAAAAKGIITLKLGASK